MARITQAVVRRLVAFAYEDGWRDACDDHMQQRKDPEHPIGAGRRREVDDILARLDHHDVLGLRGR